MASKLTQSGARRPLEVPNAPPAIWRAFAAQAAWKSWVMVALLGVIGLLLIANIQLARRPPEYVLVDNVTGDATLVRHSLATDALLRFLAEKTAPPKVSIVRFTRDFLHLALAVNSSTVEANWPAALGMMSAQLRAKVMAEPTAQKLVETYKSVGRKTELHFDALELLDRTDTLLAVRAVITRRVGPLIDDNPGQGTVQDRVQVDVVEEIVPPTVERPDGLQVVEWRLAKLEGGASPAGALAAPSVPVAATEPAGGPPHAQ